MERSLVGRMSTVTRDARKREHTASLFECVQRLLLEAHDDPLEVQNVGERSVRLSAWIHAAVRAESDRESLKTSNRILERLFKNTASIQTSGKQPAQPRD